MPYVDVSVQKTGYQTTTHEAVVGYDPIPVHRPKFIYFEFVGLRPNIPHWLFFGNKEVTRFVNTSYSESDFTSASGNSSLKEPGEQYVNATSFPSASNLAYSGATNGGAVNTPITSNANGVLSGVFYLQSNASISWPINNDGHTFMAIDISSPNKAKCKSYGTAIFRGFGQYENYYQYSTTSSYTYTAIEQVWQEPVVTPTTNAPPTTTPNTSSSKNDDNSNDKEMCYYEVTNWSGTYTYYDTVDNANNAINYYSHPGNDKYGSAKGLGSDGATHSNGDYIAETKAEAKNNESSSNSSNDSCVIATHGVESGGFSKLDKAKAEIWCSKKYHGLWYGEAFRRGYRHLGRRAIEKGQAREHYQEFKDFVDYGRGRKKGFKFGLNYYFRTLQFFIVGLFVKEI
tara:strand:+ start:2447 stop:3646 length:1200 start_codon:yes stop_codon:yes gene_type:complete